MSDEPEIIDEAWVIRTKESADELAANLIREGVPAWRYIKPLEIMPEPPPHPMASAKVGDTFEIDGRVVTVTSVTPTGPHERRLTFTIPGDGNEVTVTA